ncbi:MAG: hypothetical protein OXG35_26940 [Acidobacteria bacterium]|nr:hypothetical protein [Acidobacteriota bacterium]
MGRGSPGSPPQRHEGAAPGAHPGAPASRLGSRPLVAGAAGPRGSVPGPRRTAPRRLRLRGPGRGTWSRGPQALEDRLQALDDRLRAVEVAFGKVDRRLETLERTVLPAPADD